MLDLKRDLAGLRCPRCRWSRRCAPPIEILELLPIATCVCDAAGRIVQYNHRAVELWGRPPEPGQTHDQFTAQCKFFSGLAEKLPRSKLSEVLQPAEPSATRR